MSDNNDQERSIFNFAAIKTAIVNAEESKLDELLGKHSMQELEKGYLLDLAKMNNNEQIIARIERVPTKG